MPVILTLGRYRQTDRQTLKACLSYIASSEIPWAAEDLVPERAKLGMVALIPPLIPALRRQVSGGLRSLGYIGSSGCTERRCLTENKKEDRSREKGKGGGGK